MGSDDAACHESLPLASLASAPRGEISGLVNCRRYSQPVSGQSLTSLLSTDRASIPVIFVKRAPENDAYEGRPEPPIM